MLDIVLGIGRKLVRLAQGEAVEHAGMKLPALWLRLGRPHFDDDAVFLASGSAEAKRLVEHCGLSCDSSIVEIGCGTGRLAIGILAHVGELRRYVGVDVSARSIAWCARFIARGHPNFSFVHIDVSNHRYNPGGTIQQRDMTLPIDERSVDIIYLYSVFSHLLVDDVEAYLSEFARLLTPQGTVFLTGFFEQGVPDVTENPANYRNLSGDGRLHCVRYDEGFFRGLAKKHGLVVERLEHGMETDGQSGVFLKRERLSP